MNLKIILGLQEFSFILNLNLDLWHHILYSLHLSKQQKIINEAIKINCQNIEISNNNKICIIAGPCQLETEQHAMDMAGKIKEITSKFDLDLFIKLHLIKLIEQVLKVRGEQASGVFASF